MATVVDALERGVQPDSAQVIALVQDAAARAHILARPAAVAALMRIAEAQSALACETVEDDLAALIDAEQVGGAAVAPYQPVIHHLSYCPNCFEQYQLARAIITAQQSGELPRWPLLDGTHQPSSPPVVLIIPRREIRRGFRAPEELRAVYRGGAPTHELIYDGTMPGHAGMFIQVLLVPPPGRSGNAWQIVVQLRGSGVRADLLVTLTSGADHRSATTNARGEVRFDDIPHSWINADGDADLHVKVDAPIPPA